MTYTSEDMEIKAFPIRIENEGKITIPEDLKTHLSLVTGDMLTLLQIGDVVLLTPKQPQVPQIADKITAMMEDANLEIGDLLQGLESERQAIWQEQQNHA
jgi:bifunctional DNA-binding transcriptional regulator/antitoxin component of YhaV-PrlF toxin-antitoxin module